MIAALHKCRCAGLSLAFAGLLAACWSPEQVSEPVRRTARVAPRPAPAASSPSAAPPVSLAQAAAPADPPPAVKADIADPFAATNWSVPAPPPPAGEASPQPVASAPPAPPAAPSAPPNPFVYVGSYKDGSQQVVMLMRGEQLLLIQQGETIDNTYRLERILPGGLVMTYLPLQLRQSVPITDPV